MYAEMLALITSILCFKWLYQTAYIYFVPYLAMTVAAEIMGGYTGAHHLYQLNIKIFNVTTGIEFLFFFAMFYVSIRKFVFKKIIGLLAVFYILFAVINLTFIQGFLQFNSYSMLFGTLIIMTCSFFYFYDAFENNEPINLLKEPMFWICIGIFAFYLGDFTFNSMYPFLTQNNIKREQHLFGIINHNLIVFEYLCISIGLIICSRNRMTLKREL